MVGVDVDPVEVRVGEGAPHLDGKAEVDRDRVGRDLGGVRPLDTLAQLVRVALRRPDVDEVKLPWPVRRDESVYELSLTFH